MIHPVYLYNRDTRLYLKKYIPSPMMHTYYSNTLEQLQQQLVHIIQYEPLPTPFHDEYILVQNSGMAQWLQQNIASATGIAATLKFPLPASFIWDSFQKIITNIPKTSFFSKESITWKINALATSMHRRS